MFNLREIKIKMHIYKVATPIVHKKAFTYLFLKFKLQAIFARMISFLRVCIIVGGICPIYSLPNVVYWPKLKKSMGKKNIFFTKLLLPT